MSSEKSAASVLTNLLNTTKGYKVGDGNLYRETPAKSQRPDVYEPLITQSSVNRLADQMETYIDPAILQETKLSDTLKNAFQTAQNVRYNLDQKATLDTGHMTRSVITKGDLQFHAEKQLSKVITPEQREKIITSLQEKIEHLPQGEAYHAAAKVLKANIDAVNNADRDNNGKVTVGELLCSLADNKVLIKEGEHQPGHKVPEPVVRAIPVGVARVVDESVAIR